MIWDARGWALQNRSLPLVISCIPTDIEARRDSIMKKPKTRLDHATEHTEEAFQDCPLAQVFEGFTSWHQNIDKVVVPRASKLAWFEVKVVKAEDCPDDFTGGGFCGGQWKKRKPDKYKKV